MKRIQKSTSEIFLKELLVLLTKNSYQEREMKTALIFFSATGNTRAMAEILRDKLEILGASADLYDVTTSGERRRGIGLSGYDFVLFGFPVHSLRAPRIMRDWLETLDGKGMKCAMFFTYGGFAVHPAHHSTAEILRKQNFIVAASAEFPGKHTYNLGGWRAFEGRPDIRESELAEKYAQAVYRRFSGADRSIIGELDRNIFSDEQLDAFEAFRYKMVSKLPSRDGEGCCMCGICEKICPSDAMDYKKGTADPERCIACLGCVAACPEKVLKINSTESSWEPKLRMSETTEAALNSQVGRIYL